MDILLIDPPYITLKDVPTDSCYNVGNEVHVIADSVQKKTIVRFIVRKMLPFWRW